jgi:peptidoglycan-N-acetylmuramic acid deacetylase
MHKLINRFDLTWLYEGYSRLVTAEGKKQFFRTVYTLSICAIAIIFIWYCGIASLNIKNPNFLSQMDLSMGKELSSLGAVKVAKDIKHNNSAIQNEKTDKKEFDKKESDKKDKSAALPKAVLPKASVPKTAVLGMPVKKAKDQTKKKYGILNKTIYMGANTSKISLTFDDGYNKKTVEKVLDVLKKNNIKTTFFIIGKVLDDYPEVWKRAIDEGHQICNHTNYHEVLTNMPDNLVEAEIKGWETSAKKALGEDYFNRMKKDFPYLRLPGGGGERSDRILSIAQKNGYIVVGWNLETFSSIINPLRKTNSVQEISNKIKHHIINNCSNGSIILLHFNQYDTGNIDEIIKGIKNRGFNMQPLSQIIK